MKNDIETLVEQLDNATVSTTEVVKLVQLKGIDPQLVQTGRQRHPGHRPAAEARRLRRRRLPRRWRWRLPRRRRLGRLPAEAASPVAADLRRRGRLPAAVGGGGADRRWWRRSAAADRRRRWRRQPRRRGREPDGGGGGGRGGRQAFNGGMEGPLNFDYPGMDAPSTAGRRLRPDEYDLRPDARRHRVRSRTRQHLPDSAHPAPASVRVDPGRRRTSPPMPPPKQPGAGPCRVNRPEDALAPRGTVTAIPIPGLDTVVIRTTNAADLQLILELIERLKEINKDGHPAAGSRPARIPGLQRRRRLPDDALLARARRRAGRELPRPAAAGSSPAGSAAASAAASASSSRTAASTSSRCRASTRSSSPRRRAASPTSCARSGASTGRTTRTSSRRRSASKNASAQIVAQQLQQFWNSRYPGEPLTKNQFRVTFNADNNTVYVQASKADLEQVERAHQGLGHRPSRTRSATSGSSS